MSSKTTPTPTTDAALKSILSERDQRVLALAFLCFKEEPKVQPHPYSNRFGLLRPRILQRKPHCPPVSCGVQFLKGVYFSPSGLNSPSVVTLAPTPPVEEVDTDKLARFGNYKTKASANTAWHGVKNKLKNAVVPKDLNLDNDDASNTAADEVATPNKTPKKAATPRKAAGKKRKADDSDDDEPAGKKAKASVKEEQAEGEEDEAEKLLLQSADEVRKRDQVKAKQE